MANVLISEATMSDIADAIRTKKGVSTTYKPREMADAISSISGGGGITPTGTINITTNGTHDVTNYASASVAVPQGTTPTGTKEISITSNGTTTEDVTNYASAQITVNVIGGTMNKVTVSGTTVTQELTENTFYVFGEVTSLTVTLATPTDSSIVNEYHFRFTSGTTATVLSLPQSVTMPSGFTVEASKVYEISIVDGYGTVTSW